MKFEIGDIVRFMYKKEIFGLHEVTGESANGEITVTINECNSEFYADEKDLIMVCPIADRKDLSS